MTKDVRYSVVHCKVYSTYTYDTYSPLVPVQCTGYMKKQAKKTRGIFNCASGNYRRKLSFNGVQGKNGGGELITKEYNYRACHVS